MNWKALKYLMAFSLPLTACVAFTQYGAWTFATLLYAFALIPAVELLIRQDTHNLAKAEEEMAREDRLYDWMIYLVVPVQFALLLFFLVAIQEEGLSWGERLGRITAMGVLNGAFGINVAHELGHRSKKQEQLMAKLLLLSTLYMHFFIEHNRGHHKKVSTEADPATSRKGQTVYAFWVRSLLGCYRSAWELENSRLRKKGLPIFSLQNEMLVFQLVQLTFTLLIGLTFGWQVMGYFLLASLMGALLLETVNYIEHYGLQREQKADGRYERVQPHHSWNSDHVLGRLLLFELSRHSDHHFNASRKYQVLRHHEAVPQMPTGYPGMMVMALLPPLWFWVMDRKIGGVGCPTVVEG